MNILGISAYYHDSAASLIRDGRIVAAAEEERFSRRKHDPGFPARAIRSCLMEAGVGPREIDYIAFYDKPFLKFERILETYCDFAPRGVRSFSMSMPVWIKEKLFLRRLLTKELNKTFGLTRKFRIKWDDRLLFPEHHQSHAASAFFPSPFRSSAVLTIDGVGERATTSAGVGRDNGLELLYEIHFPHSLGLLYSAFTYYTGFKVNSGEYKVMGLAPYGESKYRKLIHEHLIDLKEDGSFALNVQYFNYCAGLAMTNNKFNKLFGGPPRSPEAEITQREMDLARSIQDVTEEAILAMTRFLKRETGEENLCLAGGVALNCVANGKILREGIFKNIWIQPAPGDAGGAIGAALAVWHQYLENERVVERGSDSMKGAYLGPSYSKGYIESFLDGAGIPYVQLGEESLVDRVALLLAEGNVIGWFQGRMEFGPRALGARSIIADARSQKMQSKMNLKIKYRESFRPFASSVLRERAKDYFELDCDSPYMLLVAPVRKERRIDVTPATETQGGINSINIPRSDIPAVTHVDYSSRIQTVHEKTDRRYYKLIKSFEDKTGCPVIVNTSFNVRGEPIVCSPEDAYTCFMRTEMDFLVLEDFILDKSQQRPLKEDGDWRKKFELD